MERLFTIGVYGYDEDRFFDALTHAHVDLFLDIRRRRGLRGSLYPFANANRLQEKLAALGIEYRHLIELAPTNTTRALQSREDEARKVARRERVTLSDAFIRRYSEETLEPFDWESLVADLEAVKRPVLMCVEGEPQACHRRLAADHLAARGQVPITDLVP